MSVDDEWIEIATQRLKKIREGTASTTPHDEVMRMVDADLDEIDRQRLAKGWEAPEMDVYGSD